MLCRLSGVSRAATLALFLIAGVEAQAPPFRFMKDLIPGDAGPGLGLADFDLDGDLDLLTNGTGIYLNDGNGRFTAHPVMSKVIAHATSFSPYTPRPVVAVGDLNWDSLPDVLAWDGSASLRKWTNQGNGVLSSVPIALPFVSAVHSIALGDVDGDGDLDLAVSLSTSIPPGSALRLWLNSGYGAFTDASSQLPAQPVPIPQIALSDLDGDGDTDLLLSGDTSGPLTSPRLFLNNGLGAFPQTYISLPTTGGHNTFALGDVNGDGQQDIAVDSTSQTPCSTSVPPVVLINNGGGSFSPLPSSGPISTASGVPYLVNVDGDASDDLVRITRQGTAIHLLSGGTIGPPTSVSPILQAPHPGAVSALFYAYENAVGDLDGDGDLDLVAFTGQGNLIGFNDGSGHLIPVRDYLTAPKSIGYHGCDAGDLEGDGDVDLVLGFYDCPDTGPASQTPGIHVAVNDGRGNLSEIPPLPFTGAPATSYGARVLFDADQDGDLDGFVSEPAWSDSAPQVHHFISNSGASFAVTQSFTVSGGPTITAVLKAADLDADGDVDLISGMRGFLGGPVASHVLRNDGAGSFQVGPSLPPSATWDMAIVDVDGDSDLDIVQANAPSSKIFLNDGMAGFTPSGNFPAMSAHSVEAADIDSDGDVDLLMDTTIVLNAGAGTFSLAGGIAIPSWSVNSYAASPCVRFVDVNLDGYPDLVDSNGNLYQNHNSTGFSSSPLPGFLTSPIVHADFDRDGDEDLVAAGPAILTNMKRQLSRGLPARPGRLASLEIGGPPGSAWALYASAGQSTVPIPPLGTVFLDLVSTQLIGLGTISSNGLSTVSAITPSWAGIVGLTLYWQAVVVQPQGPRLTGLEVTTVAAF